MTDQWDDRALEIVAGLPRYIHGDDLAIIRNEFATKISALAREAQAAGQAAAPAWRPTHQHYKGGLYRVFFAARHTETEEWLTVYDDERGNRWVRPERMFNETMGNGMRRFTPLPPPPEPQG